MDRIEKSKLIFIIASEVQKDPSLMKDIIQACSDGMIREIRAERERSCDYETVSAAIAYTIKNNYISKQMKEWARGIIVSKVNKWKSFNSCNWDEYLKD